MHRILFIILIGSLLFSCTNKEASQNGKLKVVATTGMIYDAAINIGSDRIDAEYIMGPGVDPHLYKATQGDLSKLNKANVVLYNGILLEGKMAEILEKLGRQKPVFAVAEVIAAQDRLTVANYENAYDPHVWFDIVRWKQVVQEVSNSLSQIDGANKEFYLKNTTEYLGKLDSLDSYVRARVAEIPEKQRILVTAHDAFGYFGDSYGVQVKGLQGISTVADFGLKDIAEIIDLIIDNNIKAIFVETSVSEKSINAVVQGCKEKGHDVSIGGSLYSDAMGELGTTEGTYIGMFRSNIETIVNALK